VWVGGAPGRLSSEPAGVLPYYLFGPGKFTGSWEERIPVPPAPSLVGLRVWGQAATVFADGSALYLNAVSVVLRAR
jgi:hypothetical protein